MSDQPKTWKSWLSKRWHQTGGIKTAWQKSWRFIRSRSWGYWLSLQWLPPLLETLATVTLRLGTLALALFVVVFLIQLFKDQGYVVRPISVPTKLTEAGYTDQVAALRMVATITEVKEIATSIKTDSLQVKGDVEDLDLAVLGVGFSMRTLVEQLRNVLGQQSKSIGGEITLLDSVYQLNLRITGFPTIRTNSDLRIVANQQEALGQLLRKAAEQILLYSDPYRQILLCNRERRYDEALTAVQYLLRNRPAESHWGYLGWGIILEEQNQMEIAVQKYERAVKIKPDFAVGWARLADGYASLDNKEAAIAAMHRNLLLEPEHSWRFNNYGWLLVHMGEVELADSIFQEGIKWAANEEERNYMGMSYASGMLEANELEKAKLLVEKYSLGIENSADGALVQALIAFVEQDTARVERYLEDALEIDPRAYDVVSANINVANMLGQSARVVEVYHAADWSEIDPDKKYYLWLLTAQAQLDLGDPRAAKQLLFACQGFVPYSTKPSFYLAQACYELSQKDSSLYYLRTAFEQGYELEEEQQQSARWQTMLEDVDVKLLVDNYQPVALRGDLPASR